MMNGDSGKIEGKASGSVSQALESLLAGKISNLDTQLSSEVSIADNELEFVVNLNAQ